jgi:hypothetical protein
MEISSSSDIHQIIRSCLSENNQLYTIEDHDMQLAVIAEPNAPYSLFNEFLFGIGSDKNDINKPFGPPNQLKYLIHQFCKHKNEILKFVQLLKRKDLDVNIIDPLSFNVPIKTCLKFKTYEKLSHLLDRPDIKFTDDSEIVFSEIIKYLVNEDEHEIIKKQILFHPNFNFEDCSFNFDQESMIKFWEKMKMYEWCESLKKHIIEKNKNEII